MMNRGCCFEFMRIPTYPFV